MKKSLKELELELYINLKKISKLKNYDYEKLLYSLIHLTSQLLYFYEIIAQGKTSSDIWYKRNKESLEHKMVYINLGRGFPKELMDGHWCYVLRDMGAKIMIIPSTSIKEDSIFDERYDMDIKSKVLNKKLVSRLCISEIRTVDVQRIDKRKKFMNVITNRKEIIQFVKMRIF